MPRHQHVDYQVVEQLADDYVARNFPISVPSDGDWGQVRACLDTCIPRIATLADYRATPGHLSDQQISRLKIDLRTNPSRQITNEGRHISACRSCRQRGGWEKVSEAKGHCSYVNCQRECLICIGDNDHDQACKCPIHIFY